MIEVMPFLHIICNIIERQMAGQDDKAILATIMVAIAMSTILTGIVFLLLGVFKLGNIIQVCRPFMIPLLDKAVWEILRIFP